MIYLDNAATTKICSKAIRKMEPFLKDYFGNPSGIYELGETSKNVIDETREIIADALHCGKENVFFTSGGTESDNWVLNNAKNYGRHIITSQIEHHAVLNKCRSLKDEGIQTTYVDVDKNGIVDIERIEDSIDNDTSLISIMFANNEIGTIQPIRMIGEIANRNNVPFHTDAVQAFGHIPIDVDDMKIDMLSASSHKFHGPKGVGFLYVRDPEKMHTMIHGGGQERGKRAGTENVAGIAGMGAAAKEAIDNMKKRLKRETDLRNYLIRRIMGEVPYTKLNGHPTERLPGNANFTFAGIDGASLVVLMDNEGICISAGSACSAGSGEPSHVITAIGIPKEVSYGTVRLTLSYETTKQEIDYTVYRLKENIRKLRARK